MARASCDLVSGFRGGVELEFCVIIPFIQERGCGSLRFILALGDFGSGLGLSGGGFNVRGAYGWCGEDAEFLQHGHGGAVVAAFEGGEDVGGAEVGHHEESGARGGDEVLFPEG